MPKRKVCRRRGHNAKRAKFSISSRTRTDSSSSSDNSSSELEDFRIYSSDSHSDFENSLDSNNDIENPLDTRSTKHCYKSSEDDADSCEVSDSGSDIYSLVSDHRSNDSELSHDDNNDDNYSSMDQSDDEDSVVLTCSEDEDSDDEEFTEKPTLVDRLRTFVAVSGSVHADVNLLLKILHESDECDTTNVPKCYQTLMGTAKEKHFLQGMGSGQFIHYQSIADFIWAHESALKHLDHIEVDVCSDGFKPFKSSALTVWPVMCAIVDQNQLTPFLNGCYAGYKSPKDCEQLLKDLLDEIEILREDGVYLKSVGITLQVEIRLFIGDAPARAMLCGIMGHASYEGCPLCVLDERIYEDKVIYTSSIGKVLRTDESFASRTHPKHHRRAFRNNISRLEMLNFRMVSQFPIDDMHCIELGVVKKMLGLMKLKKTGDAIDIDTISKRMTQFQQYRPSDFARDCRSLEYLPFFKATEFRLFLYYVCVVFLKDSVNDYIYRHWLLLHCSVRLLSDDDLQPENIDQAEQFITEFVRLFPNIYGEENVTYNVHVLLHIPYYVRRYGGLHKFGMFKFENYIQTIKKFVRKAHCPLQQIANRLKEHEKYNDGFYFAKNFDAFVLMPNEKDAFIAIKHNQQIFPARFLRRFTTSEGVKRVEVFRCMNIKSIYTWPLDSKQLGELSYESLSSVKESFPEDEIFYKYCRIPHNGIFVLVPILHTASLRFGK